MRYDPTRDPELEKQWLEQTKVSEIPLTSECLIQTINVGPKGAALQIEGNKFIQKRFKVDYSNDVACKGENVGSHRKPFHFSNCGHDVSQTSLSN